MKQPSGWKAVGKSTKTREERRFILIAVGLGLGALLAASLKRKVLSLGERLKTIEPFNRFQRRSKMHTRSRVLLTTMVVFSLALVFCVNQRPAFAADKPERVTVVNTPANPVPITGSTTVSGNVNATITGTPNVNVANQPVDVDKARHPVYLNGGTVSTITQADFDIVTVPAGKRLIVEHIACDAGVPTANDEKVRTNIAVVLPSVGLVTVFPLVMAPQGAFSGQDHFVVSQQVHWYFEPGTTIEGNMIRNSSTGNFVANCQMVGYQIDVP